MDAERLLQRLLAKLLRFNCITRHTPEVRQSPEHSLWGLDSQDLELGGTELQRLLAKLLRFNCITRHTPEERQPAERSRLRLEALSCIQLVED